MKVPIAVLPLFACLPCFAQIPADSPGFEAASIRPAEMRGPDSLVTSPGTFTARNESLLRLICWAYDTPQFQVTGPDWLREERFDVIAKSPNGGDDDRLRLMLRKLLADRFGLKAHADQKEMQVYAVTLAKGGFKMPESTDDGPPVFDRGGPTLLTAHHVTMKDFAEKVSEPLGRPVLDETGLKGKYEIKIDVAAYMQSNGQTLGEGQVDVMAVLFNALQQQLGVKLESKKETVNMLTVDHVEKQPTEN
ncbi:MAG TPA: TIGR03435 family protein [Bryobacteraceae bacterium]|nr:TIGR03435 family protein [Bryobacteraceae bacterium]